MTTQTMATEIIDRVQLTNAVLRTEAAVQTQGQKTPIVEIRGMPIHAINMRQCIDHILNCLARGHGGWVVTPNLDILRRYVTSDAFRALVASATLNVADGMPLVWASRARGTPLPERLNGTDLMCCLTEAAACRGHSVYLLGGSPGTAESATESLCEKYPDLEVAGCHCPPFGFERDVSETARIEKKLIAAQPDIVFVGLGSPKQDVLINSLRARLPNTWWIGVGVSFSFVSGDLPRAPIWAQRSGLEWLYRLCADPRRLAKRYLMTGIPFFISTMVVSAFQRVFCSSYDGLTRERTRCNSVDEESSESAAIQAEVHPRPPSGGKVGLFL